MGSCMQEASTLRSRSKAVAIHRDDTGGRGFGRSLGSGMGDRDMLADRYAVQVTI